MADNVRITQKANSTPPDGTVVATDLVGTAHYQWFKLDGGGDGVSVPIKADGATNAMQSISHEHHETHEGNAYEYTDVTDLAINNVLDIQITTPNTTKWAHMIGNFQTKSETEWYLYENVTINNTGTTVTPINCDRNSTGSAGLVLANITNTTVANANADTVVAGATELLHGISGAGRQQGKTPNRGELILKQNEDYSLRFVATAAGYISFQLTWYEHENL